MPRSIFRIVTAVVLTLLPVSAQTISSGSTGADGALNLTVPGTVVFDPTALGLDADGDNVFNFTTINIGAGVTVKLTSARLKGKSVVWLASGAVQISGIIDLSGANGQPIGDTNAANHIAEPGPGGFHGGFGGTPLLSSTSGGGPGAGLSISSAIQGGNAGHALPGESYGPPNFGAAYGNAVLVPLRGGSGGGGGQSGGTGTGGGGGAGGGALRIFSSVSITVAGAIASNGGDGGVPTPSFTCCHGGGGSGGAIHLIAPVISGTGTLFALGGKFNNSTPTASVGRIRLDAFTQSFTGTSTPTASQGGPYQIPLPANVPTLRLVTVNGVAVPPTPAGVSSIADVTVNTASPIPVALEARNIPVGTIIKVNVVSDAAGDSVVNSTPLTGTLALSTASATIQPQPGFTRLSIRATW